MRALLTNTSTTTATFQAPPEVDDRVPPPGRRLPEETPPARVREETPAKSRKDDDVLVPMALAGLSLFSGIV